MQRWLIAGAVLASVLVAAGPAPAQTLTPHIVGWERYFTVTWETFERRGRTHVGGYVVNQHGAAMGRVRLLVDSLDASGRVLAQRVDWLVGDVPPFGRRYFEAPVPQPAAAYRVSVFTFDPVQGARLMEAP